MKSFDNLATNIQKTATHSKTLEDGRKIMYWKNPVTGNLKEGIVYIEYNNKPQTIMAAKEKWYKDQ